MQQIKTVFAILTKCALKGLIYLMHAVRPLLGSTQCKFFITCTAYAKHTLHTKHIGKAVGLIMLRLLCCSPLYTFIPAKIRILVCC